jgi:hypothetical protein
MKPKLLGLVLLIATGVAAAPAAAQASAADVPLMRMRDGHGSDLLFRLNPQTLQQVGRPIRTFRGGSALSISPDGAFQTGKWSCSEAAGTSATCGSGGPGPRTSSTCRTAAP